MEIPATARQFFPMLSAGQAQKEVAHNEALTMIDLLLNPVVEAVDALSPPLAPVEGQGWIIGGAPEGDWLGRAGEIAWWTTGGWRFFKPFDGLRLWVREAAHAATFADGHWEMGVLRTASVRVDGVQVVGQRASAIADPEGEGAVDADARRAIREILVALRSHGLIST